MGKNVDAGWIARHGQKVEDYVCSMVDEAKKAISADGVYNLEGGDFSVTFFAASAGYPTAVQFAFEDIETLKKEADEMVHKLTLTAERYHNTEQANAEH